MDRKDNRDIERIVGLRHHDIVFDTFFFGMHKGHSIARALLATQVFTGLDNSHLSTHPPLLPHPYLLTFSPHQYIPSTTLTRPSHVVSKQIVAHHVSLHFDKYEMRVSLLFPPHPSSATLNR